MSTLGQWHGHANNYHFISYKIQRTLKSKRLYLLN